MSETLELVKDLCAALNTQERADLANFLLEAPQAPDEEVALAWREEVRRRLDEIRAGQVIGKPASQVFAEVRERYR